MLRITEPNLLALHQRCADLEAASHELRCEYDYVPEVTADEMQYKTEEGVVWNIWPV